MALAFQNWIHLVTKDGFFGTSPDKILWIATNWALVGQRIALDAFFG